MALASAVRVDIGPFTATLSVRPSTDGKTVVSLAPLGTIQLDTHRAPVVVRARVDELRIEEAEAIARDPAVLERFEAEVVDDAKSALRALVIRSVLAAILGGVIAALATALARKSLVVGGAVSGVLLAAGLGATVMTWRAEALAEPRYTGLLTIAPKAVGGVESVIERFGQYRAQLSRLVENVITLYGVGQGLPTFDPTESIRLLHVSDIHLNPQAFDLMARVVPNFDIDAIVDTGDITDWGSEPESRVLDRIGGLSVPYVWVRGNHDSLRTQEAIAAQPNSVVLDGNARTIAGLRMWGHGDPRYTPDKSQPVGPEVERGQAAAAAPQLAAALRAAMPPPVDVAIVHDAQLAAALGDLTPLVLAGHSHEPRQGTVGRALLLVEGSTGGSGLRTLEGLSPDPLTCSVLYFNATTKDLVAYDRIAVEGLGQSGVRIERHVVAGRSGGPTATTIGASTTSSSVARTATTAPPSTAGPP